MAELPYMQFFPADWLADTRMLTASAKGVWIDTLADLWSAPERGLREASEREWARLWGVEPERVHDLLRELGKVAGIRREGERVTIYSRRIIREELERERSRNSKRTEDKREWSYRESMTSKVPELFPDVSRKVPGDFPPDSRRIPGDIPETRDQSGKLPNKAPASEPPPPSAIPSLDDVKRYALSAPVPISAECAVAFHDTQQAEGWLTRNGHPIADWRAALRRYASRWNEIEKTKGPAFSAPGQPRQRPASGYGESTDISNL